MWISFTLHIAKFFFSFYLPCETGAVLKRLFENSAMCVYTSFDFLLKVSKNRNMEKPFYSGSAGLCLVGDFRLLLIFNLSYVLADVHPLFDERSIT